MEVIRRPVARSSLAALFFSVLTVGAFFCTRYLDSSVALIDTNAPQKPILTPNPLQDRHNTQTLNIPLNCTHGSPPLTCPGYYYPSEVPPEASNLSWAPPLEPSTCPDYFRWIHDDLWPWRETGITEEMVTSAARTATFRLVIVGGRAYVQSYSKSFQSRDTFTLWGILQLLRRYPGKVPDLDLMFDCVDWPVVKKEEFGASMNLAAPPPLFRYCGDNETYDIVFPDWSFWGCSGSPFAIVDRTYSADINIADKIRPEINIKPWEQLLNDLKKGNKRKKWMDRDPHAYWKGNPAVAATRMDLLKCNVSDKHDWNARVYAQDWLKEQKQGYKQSDLASQCVHRYKIYIEGSAWSVSEKYILACDSVTLLVKPRYYDFFTRSLMPLKHYWPIKEEDKCRSIKYAVDWGNSHPEEAQGIGRAGSRFILKELKMDYIYDYMFHLLSEYAKLLKYKPKVPQKAVEVCSESVACLARGFEKQFMTSSLVKGPLVYGPCEMPPPYGPASFHSVIEERDNGIKKVDDWERIYWESHKM